MNSVKTTLAPAALALLLSPALPAAAQETSGDFSGSFRVGFRSVDVSGAERKYKEDYNLDDGPRLFDLTLRLVPEEGLRGVADEMTLDLANFGGDPFETLSLGVRKHGSYDFRYHRRKSSYFYEDLILPPDLADVRLSSGGDFHTFDFDRVRDSARLGLQLTRAAKLSFGFERFTKRGESTTTLDLQRDEFELDRPIDETMDEYLAGFEYKWDKATLVLEERIREYENLMEIFLPGFSEGENATNATNLAFFFLDQPYDSTSYEHTVRFIARPNRKLNLSASASLQDLSLDVEAAESSQGTGFNGQPFTTSASGDGEIDREAELAEVDLSYWINDRFAVVGSAWYRNLDQSGSFTFGGVLNQGEWEIETTGVKAGLQVHLSSKVVVAGGISNQSRDVNSGHNEEGGELERESETTDHTGYFATLAWNPTRAFNLSVEAEDNSYDDPFTLVSATGHQRLRVRGRYTLTNGLSFSGGYLAHRFENDNSGWDSDRDQLDLRLAYRRDTLSVSLGYSLVDVEQAIDQEIVTIPGLVQRIFYEIDSDFIDGHLRWQVSDRFAVGGDAVLYDNAGSFGLARDDLRGYVEVGFLEGYQARLGYRTIDYTEDDFDFDDYDADMLELSIGYGW